MKSRPVYGRLEIVSPAVHHLAVADGRGLAALERAFATPAGDMPLTVVLAGGREVAGRAEALRAGALHLMPTTATALIRLKGLLQTAAMGTRLYIAGSESFVGEVEAVALDFGLTADAIRTEAISPARRVQCVHCKGITDEVEESPFRCSHCGLALLVRDHYSRRLGAFQGDLVGGGQDLKVLAVQR